MLYKILYPITFPYVIVRLWKTATPEQKAMLRSKTASDEEKNVIAEQIGKKAFPNLV